MHQATESIVRLSRPNDISQLRDLDLKCFQYPFSMAQWQHFIQGSGKKNEPKVILVEVVKSAVGYAMWEIDTEANVLSLLRIGVLPPFRRKKLGSTLFMAVIKDAQRNQLDKIRCVVPDIHCVPNDPDNVSGFLLANGLSATGEIVYDAFQMYGSNFDGYVFERGVL